GEDILALLAKVSNKTKGLTWIYNPVVYSEPEVDEDVAWLSYWPIGNILDTGDEVNVDIIVGNGFIVSGCGATLVYMDGELSQENCNPMIKEEEVIGGDLSEFELTKGAFYLCRRDFFKSMTPDWLKTLVGDTMHYEELKGWKKSRQSRSKASYSELKTFRAFQQINMGSCGQEQDTTLKATYPPKSAAQMHKMRNRANNALTNQRAQAQRLKGPRNGPAPAAVRTQHQPRPALGQGQCQSAKMSPVQRQAISTRTKIRSRVHITSRQVITRDQAKQSKRQSMGNQRRSVNAPNKDNRQ
ncbi:hypothetical protein Tco_1477868, partial [Tanacetum coccineum]